MRPALTAMSGTCETTDPSGVSARSGRVEDTAAVFGTAAEDPRPAETLPEPDTPPG
jgi:hypothetical protein